MDKESIDKLLQSGACTTLNASLKELLDRSDDAAEALIIPDGFKVHSLEHLYPHRFFPRGTSITSNLPSFRQFVTDNGVANQLLTVDQEKMVSTAFLDYVEKHGSGDKAQGHCRFRSIYQATRTADFNALLRYQREKMSQMQFADFIQDNRYCLTLEAEEGTGIPISQGIIAVRTFTVEKTSTSTHEQTQLTTQHSSLERLDASSKSVTTPVRFSFNCIPYIGFKPRTFEARVTLHIHDKLPPQFSYTVINYEKHVELIGEEFLEKIQGAFTDLGITIFLGTFDPN